MKLDAAGVLADAWADWRRDRELLFRIAGPFLFLPSYTLYIAVPPPPAALDRGQPEADQLAWINAYGDWLASNGGWYVAASLLVYFGTLTIVTLYLDPTRPDLRAALARAARLFPRYMLAVVAMSVPAGLGLLLFLLPGLYLLGRIVPIGPALVAERPIGVRAAIGRSLALTQGNGLLLAGFATLTLVGGAVAAEPFLAIDRALRAAGIANPVAIAIIDAGAAAMTAISLLAGILFQIAIYRRLAGLNRGI